MRLVLALATALVVLLLAAPSARADDLYSATFEGALVQLDTFDGGGTPIGSDGQPSRAAAFDLDGTLYTTVNSGRQLGTFDLTTGAVTIIGPILTSGTMDAIEIDASGNLYGVTRDGWLYQIDKATGTPTYVSYVNVRSIADLAYDPDGNLWAVAENRLFLVDVATGATTYVGSVATAVEGLVYGIAFDGDGRLWATSTVLDAPLYEIDPATLDVDLVGTTGIDYPRGCDVLVAPEASEPAPPLDTDGDGYPDDVDAFPESDLRATVRVGEHDTGVENVLFDDGATLADLVAACAVDAARHGTFVRRVAHLLIGLRRDGAITRAEKSAILRAVARSHGHRHGHGHARGRGHGHGRCR